MGGAGLEIKSPNARHAAVERNEKLCAYGKLQFEVEEEEEEEEEIREINPKTKRKQEVGRMYVKLYIDVGVFLGYLWGCFTRSNRASFL